MWTISLNKWPPNLVHIVRHLSNFAEHICLPMTSLGGQRSFGGIFVYGFLPCFMHLLPSPCTQGEGESERAKHKSACAGGQENHGGLNGTLIPGRILVQLVPKSLNVFTSPLHSVTTS